MTFQFDRRIHTLHYLKRGRMFLSFPLCAITPTVALMLLTFGIPLAFSLLLSTRGWSVHHALSNDAFVGFGNFLDLLADHRFIWSMTLTVLFTAATVAIELLLGLAVALLLNMDLRFIGVFRTIIVIPMVMTPIVAAATWKLLLNRQGLINYLVGAHISWLGDTSTALIAVSLVNIWQNAPFVAILLLAGLRSLPDEPFEASAIDGANACQSFCYVTLPLLRPYILVAAILRTIFEFRSFDNVYLMTFGGPADSTLLMSIFTYMISFVQFDLSLGAAASWAMLLIVLLACIALILMLRSGTLR